MDTLSLLIPLALILGGLIAMVIYILAMAVRQMSQRLAETNTKLLAIVAAKEGPEATRSLLALSRTPQKALAGIAAKPDKEKSERIDKGGFTVGVGI